MHRCFAFGHSGFAVLVLGIALASPAMADMQVIESNASAYKVGLTVPNTQVFELKAGERVQVLIVPGNQTRVFEGKGSHSLEPRGGARSATKRKQPE
ncbi:MAG: hypothetical protein ABWY63_07740 [Hyphomicrobiaceae bacterium]|jgi:hypothetical protein